MPNPKRTDILGRDLLAIYRITDGRHEDVDLGARTHLVRGELTSDLVTVDGVANAVQAIIHRIKTMRGELADLDHPHYGSRHHELIGQPNSEHNRNLVKLYILQALADEPRIEKILKADLRFDRLRAPDQVEIELSVSLIGVQASQNFVIPFSFSGSL